MNLEDLKVIKKFHDIILKNIPRLPHKEDTDFSIELVPGAALVSKDLYQMVVLELM